MNTNKIYVVTHIVIVPGDFDTFEVISSFTDKSKADKLYEKLDAEINLAYNEEEGIQEWYEINESELN